MNNLEQAKLYVGKGWYVFPIYEMEPSLECSCGQPKDAPKHAVGKHPRTPRGHLDATLDLDIVEAWWEVWPEANIGIDTGRSGLFVLDVDPKNGGDKALDELIKQHGDSWLTTIRVKTGSGGLHAYYTNKAELGNTASVVGGGIDTRGIGGYVLAPGSNHKSGGKYDWASRTALVLSDPPEWLVKKVLEGKPGKTGPAPPVPDRVGAGARNATAASLAGTLQRRGFVKEAILAALTVQSEQTFDPPLSDGEIEDIVNSVSRYKRQPAKKAEPKFNYREWWGWWD